MKGKIEVGEYIRTKSGRIAKCIKIEEDDGIKTYYFDSIVFSAGFHNDYDDLQENELSQIKEHNQNIKDLIEVGDFVNGNEVVSIEKKENDVINIILKSPTIYCDYFSYLGEEIITILTHEIYENNCYKINN